MRPSPAKRTHEAAYAAHLATVLESRWRLGVVDGRWHVTRRGPDTDGWLTLEESLEAFPDIDPVDERRRVASWLYELVGVRSIVLDRDYAAAAEGREAYTVVVQR